MTLPLKKFDMSKIVDMNKIVDASGNPIKILIGKRVTGISWIQRDIKYHNENNKEK